MISHPMIRACTCTYTGCGLKIQMTLPRLNYSCIEQACTMKNSGYTVRNTKPIQPTEGQWCMYRYEGKGPPDKLQDTTYDTAVPGAMYSSCHNDQDKTLSNNKSSHWSGAMHILYCYPQCSSGLDYSTRQEYRSLNVAYGLATNQCVHSRTA